MRQKLIMIAMVLAAAGATACGDKTAPGSKSTVTAYEPDGTTVIQLEPCAKVGRSYDYPSCGRKLRDQVAARMCTRGKGAHAWSYQIGNARPIPETTNCR